MLGGLPSASKMARLVISSCIYIYYILYNWRTNIVQGRVFAQVAAFLGPAFARGTMCWANAKRCVRLMHAGGNSRCDGAGSSQYTAIYGIYILYKHTL